MCPPRQSGLIPVGLGVCHRRCTGQTVFDQRPQALDALFALIHRLAEHQSRAGRPRGTGACRRGGRNLPLPRHGYPGKMRPKMKNTKVVRMALSGEIA